jgi:Flp pilus assembly protein TadG
VVVAIWIVARVRRLVRLVTAPRTQPLHRRRTIGASGIPHRSIRAHRATDVAWCDRLGERRYRLCNRFGVHRLLVFARNGRRRREVFGCAGRMDRLRTVGARSHGSYSVGFLPCADASVSLAPSESSGRGRSTFSKNDARHTLRRLSGNSHDQRGSYAVEFALVFVVFFTLFYGVLTFGLIFAAQQSINVAAQDGARALLRFSPTNSATTSATALAQTRVGWIASMSNSAVAVAVCTGPRAAGPQSNTVPCTGPALSAGQVEMVVTYPYGTAPLIPSIPLLGSLMTPVTMALQARSAVDLGYSTTH